MIYHRAFIMIHMGIDPMQFLITWFKPVVDFMIIKSNLTSLWCTIITTLGTQHPHLSGSILFSFLVNNMYNVRLIPSHSILLFFMKNGLIMKYTSDSVCTNYWSMSMHVKGVLLWLVWNLCITIERHTSELMYIISNKYCMCLQLFTKLISILPCIM